MSQKLSLDCTEKERRMRLLFFSWVLCIVHGTRKYGKTRKYEKCKFCFKIGSHSTIYTFKNYFTTVFSTMCFQFSPISGIQTDQKNLQI